MIRSVLGSRAAIGGVLGSGRGGAAAQWWLSGGVLAANAVAVYQPVGAASLAASYTNLANPGVYTAAPGVAPTFDTATGWTFNGSTQYLTTGVTPNAGGASMICRMQLSPSTVNAICSSYSTNKRFFLTSNYTGIGRIYGYGNALSISPGINTDCVMAIAGLNAYLNGSSDGTVTAGGTLPTEIILVGATAVGAYSGGIVTALAIYNTILTAPQVAAISAAMAAL